MKILRFVIELNIGYSTSQQQENLEKYKVKAMYSLQPPYDINEYYGNNDDKLDMLKEFIMQAIKLIENRLK